MPIKPNPKDPKYGPSGAASEKYAYDLQQYQKAPKPKPNPKDPKYGPSGAASEKYAYDLEQYKKTNQADPAKRAALIRRLRNAR